MPTCPRKGTSGRTNPAETPRSPLSWRLPVCADPAPLAAPVMSPFGSAPPVAAAGAAVLASATAMPTSTSPRRGDDLDRTGNSRNCPPSKVTLGSRQEDHLHVQCFPSGVHTGDHDGVHTGDHVRTPPLGDSEDAGQRCCGGIRWYPRLACPQAGEHIGAVSGQPIWPVVTRVGPHVARGQVTWHDLMPSPTASKSSGTISLACGPSGKPAVSSRAAARAREPTGLPRPNPLR